MEIIKSGGHRLFENDAETSRVVSEMLLDLEQHGMDAVRKYSARFDAWTPESFELTGEEIKNAINLLPPQVVEDTDFCQANVRRFTARYGSGLPVAGQYSGQLSNGGEALLVSDAAGLPINDFAFDDVPPWPTAADGGGPSMEVANLAGDYSSGTNWRASATPGGNPGRAATMPGDFNGNSVVDGTDLLAWQRGLGGAYAAADLPIWQANFGNGAQAVPALATARLDYSTAADTAEMAAISTALITTDQSLEGDSADSLVIDVAAFTRSSWWLVVENGQLASPSTRSVINKPAAAFDAAMAEWASRHRSSVVADDFSAAVAANDHGSREHFAALDRPGSARRSVSLRDHLRLRFGDEIVDIVRSSTVNGVVGCGNIHGSSPHLTDRPRPLPARPDLYMPHNN